MAYDLTTDNGGGGYVVTAVSGNRTWSENGSPTQVQTVLGLAPPCGEVNGADGIGNCNSGGYGDDLVYPSNCPPVDSDGIVFDTSCPDCPPAGQSPVNLYVHNGDCGSYVNEDTWYNTYYDTGHDLTAVPYIPGQPLQYQCPDGIPATTGGGGGGGTTQPSLGVTGNSSYQFAYVVQGAALNIQSGSTNWYGNWSVIVSGAVQLAAAPTVGPTGSGGFMIVNATGTRTFIDGTGAVTVQSIVGVASGVNTQPSYVYSAQTGAAFIDGSYGWTLLLNGSVATPAGLAVTNVLTILQSASPAVAASALTLNVTTESTVEVWQLGRMASPCIDSVLLQPLLLSNVSGLVPSAISNVTSSLLAAAAARQQSAVLPGSAVSSTLQLYFQYRLSAPGAPTSSNQFWQVCGNGSLTIDTTRGAVVEGSVRYPVTAASGTRTLTVFNYSYPVIVQGLVNGTDNTSTTAAASTVQSITGVGTSGAQYADNLLSFAPTSTGSFPLVVSVYGVGLQLSSPAVYANGPSWSSQVTLSPSGSNQYAPGTFALSEAWGPQSVGQLMGSTSSPLSCPSPASTAGLAMLAPPLTYVLVYSLSYNTSAAITAPAFACLVATMTVSGFGVDTALGPAYAVLSVSGFHYSSAANGASSTQPLNSTISSTFVQLLYPSLQSPSVVDGNGLYLQSLDDASTYTFFYSSGTNQYVERGNGGVLTSSNVYLLPTSASTDALLQQGQAACSYNPAQPATSSSSTGATATTATTGGSSSSAATAASTASTTSTTTATTATSTATTATTATSANTAATAVSSSSPSTAQPASSTTSTGGGGATTQPTSISSTAANGVTSSSSSSGGSSPSVTSSVTSSSSATSTVAPQPNTSTSSSGLSHGAIAGIVIGSVGGALLICLICLVLLLLARSGKDKQSGSTASRSSDSSVVRPSMVTAEPSRVATVNGVPHRGARGGEMEMQEV